MVLTMHCSHALFFIWGMALREGFDKGDPLAPALFVLAMDVLHAAIQWAMEHGLLFALGLHNKVSCISIYFDHMMVLLKPHPMDFQVIAV